MAPGFAITDPNKLTLLTPGFDRATGSYAEHGIPAPVVAAISAREPRRAGEERPQLAAVPADAGRRGEQGRHAAVSALVAFKQLHDDNAPLEDAIPEFVARRPARYARHAAARPLRARCIAFFRDADVSALQARAVRAPSICRTSRMTPHEAVRQLVRNNVDYLPIDADSTAASPRRCSWSIRPASPPSCPASG